MTEENKDLTVDDVFDVMLDYEHELAKDWRASVEKSGPTSLNSRLAEKKWMAIFNLCCAFNIEDRVDRHDIIMENDND